MSNDTKQIIQHLSVLEFRELLTNNPGVIFIKFGAEWCGPCKKVDKLIQSYFNSSPDTVICAMLNVDENIDLYGYMKKNRMVNGIPAILGYIQGNTEIYPSDSVTGADIPEIHRFFDRCRNALTLL